MNGKDGLVKLYRRIRNHFRPPPRPPRRAVMKFIATTHFDSSLELEDGVEPVQNLEEDMNFQRLQLHLPGADPTFLREMVESLNDDELTAFVSFAKIDHDYPTRKEYLRRLQLEKCLNGLKKNCSLEQFLEQIPDRVKHFSNPNRANPLNKADESSVDAQYALATLHNKYPYIRKKHVDLIFRANNKKLVETVRHLDQVSRSLKTPRPVEELPNCKNLLLIQEVAYVNHKNLIMAYLEDQTQTYPECRAAYSQSGWLEVCGICDKQLKLAECFYCNNNCMFCIDCVRKYAEVRIGEGHTTFPCYNKCDSEFGIHILQLALPKAMFGRLLLKIQSEEIKKAEEDGIESCPFCDFAALPCEASNAIICNNPDCGKDSCRLCKRESHMPKPCSKVPLDNDVKIRTFLEDKLTEAVTRTCHNCKKQFVKTSGCNKMSCACGASMCFICSEPIDDYKHFKVLGGKCCLFRDESDINRERVMEHVKSAKRALGNVHVIKSNPTLI